MTGFVMLLLALPALAAVPPVKLPRCEGLAVGGSFAPCLAQIEAAPLWEPLKGNLARVRKVWKKPLRVELAAGLELASGRVKLEGEGEPLLQLGRQDDAYELLITLNHELVHYLNLRERQPLLSGKEKLSGCLTRYQLDTLKDEGVAFRAELEFWQEAPAWFRSHFKGKRFHSALLGKELGYEEYYKELRRRLGERKAFVEERYVELGEYPACAKKLL